jgi:DNA-binding response OmpR family regulator
MVLERAMYEVVQATNGQEALDEVFINRPDLIVCDLMMPHMDGTETVQILRRDPETRKIPVLMLTAADSVENEIKLIQTGADDFVSKTADQRVLLSRVDRLLQRSNAAK